MNDMQQKEPTMTTKYAYVPFNRSANIDSDAIYNDSNGCASGPAGRVIATTDGSYPRETQHETMDGRYAQPVSYRTLRHHGFSADELRDIRA